MQSQGNFLNSEPNLKGKNRRRTGEIENNEKRRAGGAIIPPHFLYIYSYIHKQISIF